MKGNVRIESAAVNAVKEMIVAQLKILMV